MTILALILVVSCGVVTFLGRPYFRWVSAEYIDQDLRLLTSDSCGWFWRNKQSKTWILLIQRSVNKTTHVCYHITDPVTGAEVSYETYDDKQLYEVAHQYERQQAAEARIAACQQHLDRYVSNVSGEPHNPIRPAKPRLQGSLAQARDPKVMSPEDWVHLHYRIEADLLGKNKQ